MAYLPDNARFVAKKSLERIPIFGQAMRAVGTVIIDRSRPEEARSLLSKTGVARMGKGVGVIIFPEGTRSRSGKIGQFKKGGFVLAIESGAAIVPVGISGSRNILAAGGFRVKRGEIRISIGKPVLMEGLSMNEKDTLIEKTRHQVSALSNMLLEEDPEELCTEEHILDEREECRYRSQESDRNYEHRTAM
jgi:1-acyl-sn-glycerol-3-phosphate acyltransferase